jgi:benzoyl-CoA reductase/2-hydroxyglutaryl-CoA dehydratase subunit BcrC/BadD/HgdB
MTRREVLEAHRRARLPTLAVLPIHYPREILESLDILGVELWGPPGPLPSGPSDRVQPYVCSLVRNALAFVDAGGLDGVSGLLAPNTCDSMMGLASMLKDLGHWDRPLLHLHLPRAVERESAVGFLRKEVERLWHRLGDCFERACEPDALRAALAQRTRIEEAHRALRRDRRRLPLGERALMELLREDGWWPAADHLVQAEQALASRDTGPLRDGPGVVVSGIVPEPMALLDALEAAGAVMVGDDYASTGRRLTRLAAPATDDPLEAVARRLAHRPPCSTLSADPSERLDHLVGLVRGTEARGLIVHTIRFCEPELFDLPAIKQRLDREGIPVLFVDSEVQRDLPGQLRTRLEAFVEMLS